MNTYTLKSLLKDLETFEALYRQYDIPKVEDYAARDTKPLQEILIVRDLLRKEIKLLKQKIKEETKRAKPVYALLRGVSVNT